MNDIPREKLQYIITQYGRTICDDPKRCEALLRDFCPQYKREINVLMGALKERIPSELTNGNLDTMPKEVIFARLVKRLYDNMGFAEEFCHWAVETWAVALGVISKPGVIKIQTVKAVQTSVQRYSGHSNKNLNFKYLLRSYPQNLSDEDVLVTIKKNNFFCKKWSWSEKWYNESGYFENDYKNNRYGTITDCVTGLVWQKSGSNNSMNYDNAKRYINELNRKKFAGHRDWRLPTIEELMSLLEPEKQLNNLYINPIFDKKQWRCLSADKHESGGVWFIGFGYGNVDWLVSANYYVRVVRSL